MTPAPENFANYPVAVEVADTGYVQRVDTNPVLRGIPLVLGAGLISRSNAIASYFWHNSGMTSIKDMPELDNVPPTFHPCVTPLGKTGPMLEFEPHLLKSKYAASNVRYYTASDYHEAYKSGRVTPLQVAEALLNVITKPSKYSDAWADSHGADHIALEAARASTERWAAGKPLGVLDGVPIGVKDDTDVKGYVNHIGMKYNPSIPFFKPKDKTTWPVQKLQDAGAVVIAKNKMHENGSDTNGLNVAQGTPTNHLNNAYYPGGSTNGGGSSVGAGVVPIAIGTDAGGSIRLPSNFNGIYGLKPTHHRVLVMKSTMCVTGPLAANVADLTIAYRVMSQPDPECATQGRFALSIPPSPSAKRVMGVYRDWFNKADPPVREMCEKALEYFATKRGYEIVDITIPYLPEAQLAHGATCVTELAEAARRRTPNTADWLSLVGPANRLLLSVATQGTAADYLKYNALRTVLMQHVAALFQKYPGLLIMTPTTPLIGWPRMAGDDAYGVSDTNTTMRNMSYIFLANSLGTPSLTAPVGYVDPAQGEGKLPVSLLATGEWGSEEQLLAWAAEAEEYLNEVYPEGRRRPVDWLDVLKAAEESKK